MRKFDTNWRDAGLTSWHESRGFHAPAAGMLLPMVEYDRCEPLAVLDYRPRGPQLPVGKDVGAAFRAFGKLYRADGPQLPFLTVMYDDRNWSYNVFPHNESARQFLDRNGWQPMTEQQFVNNLYRLRGRYAPDLKPFGVDFASEEWRADDPAAGVTPEPWPGQLMSSRRRNFEPVARVRMSWLNPCVDMDLAIVDPDDRVALVVDYKSDGARTGLGSTNLQALSSLELSGGYGRRPSQVPAMVVRYKRCGPDDASWCFSVHCANTSARSLLSYALGATSGDDVQSLAGAVAGAAWVDLDEQQWVDVLSVARDL